MADRLEELTQINLDDLVGAFGWHDRPRLQQLARLTFRGVAREFGRQILAFDTQTGERDLVYAARVTERLHVRDVRLHGADRLPAGSFLALSNHPGMTDTLALFAALRRPDIRVIALPRPFLVALPNVSRHLLFLPDDVSERVGLIRDVGKHLRSGGALLTFPAGHTEPDPDVYPGATDSLKSWIESAGIFVRLAPETPIIPVCVRGVAWRASAHSPLARLRQTLDDRQLLASALQLLFELMFRARPVTVKIQIGRPVRIEGRGPYVLERLHAAVLDEMRSMIENPPLDPGESVL